MRAITVRQPWAWAIVHGGKDVENRTRNLAGSYRGPVAVHAAKEVDLDAVYPTPAGSFVGESGGDAWEHLGHIIGVATLAEAHHPGDQWFDCTNGLTCSPWAMPGQWHLRLRNPRPLPAPIPARGFLGLWETGWDLERAINAALATQVTS